MIRVRVPNLGGEGGPQGLIPVFQPCVGNSGPAYPLVTTVVILQENMRQKTQSPDDTKSPPKFSRLAFGVGAFAGFQVGIL